MSPIPATAVTSPPRTIPRRWFPSLDRRSRPGIRRAWVGLLVLGVLALGVRVGIIFVLRSDWLPDTTYEHGEIARNLVEGRGFRVRFLGSEGPTSQQAPVYPFLLAGLYGVFGVDQPESLLAMQCLQAVLGAATALALVWLCWLMVPANASEGQPAPPPGVRWVGWLAGIGMALYPTHVYAVTHIQVAVLATFFVVLTLALCRMARVTMRAALAALAGLAAGITMLTDPILSLVAAVGAAVVLFAQATGVREARSHARSSLRRRSGRIWGIGFGVYVAVAVAVLLPWLLRNRWVHGEWVFVKSTFGYAFWQGNNSRSWGTDKIPKATALEFLQDRGTALEDWNRALWEARHETLYIDDVLLKPTGYRELTGLSEPEKSRALMSEAFESIRRHPGHYWRLCLQRLRYFLLFDETNPRTRNGVYRTTHLSLLALSVVGLPFTWRFRRTLWPTYAVFGLLALFHTLTITSARFHLPVEPLQLTWAAVGLVGLAKWWAVGGVAGGYSDDQRKLGSPANVMMDH